jgi:hypothetical protein
MVCSVKSCRKKVKRTTYCISHYKRFMRYGDPELGGAYRNRHNMSTAPEYTSWCKIKSRCNNPNDTAYKYYGGRGIKMAKKWEHSFETFYEDMGKKPSREHTIDRINTNKGYYPFNCRWATKSEQSFNQRKRSDNTTGIKNLMWDKNRNKWRAEVKFNGVKYLNKRFNNKQEAINAIKKAKAQIVKA